MMLGTFAMARALGRGSRARVMVVLALAATLGACGSDSSAGDSDLQGDGGAASDEGDERDPDDGSGGAAGQGGSGSDDGEAGSGGTGGSSGAQDGGPDDGEVDDDEADAAANECEPGEVLDDGACVDACSQLACGEHGSCAYDAQADEVECECDTGFTGAACAECADGFVDDGSDGCVEPCDIFDCGTGSCALVEGAPSCECSDNFAGDHCETCAPGYALVSDAQTQADRCELAVPDSDAMLAWLDADDDDSFSLANGSSYITTWSSLVGTGVDFASPAAANRPRHDDYQAGTAQSGVIFDGDDDALAESLTMGGSYSVFIVLQVASEMADQTILSGVDGDNAFGFWLRTSNQGGTLQVRHQQGGGTENVTLTGLSLTQRSLIEVHRVGLGLTLASGSASEFTVVSATPLPALDFELGRRADAGTFAMNGTIHEVIIVAPGVAPSARAQYRDYLRAKWQLE
jgi:hypothetical protein